MSTALSRKDQCVVHSVVWESPQSKLVIIPWPMGSLMVLQMVLQMALHQRLLVASSTQEGHS